MSTPFDPFHGVRSPVVPAHNAFAITPDDGVNLEAYTRFLYVGGAGDIAVFLREDSNPGGVSKITQHAAEPVVLKNVPAGTLLPLAIARVMATGTTATYLVGLI